MDRRHVYHSSFPNGDGLMLILGGYFDESERTKKHSRLASLGTSSSRRAMCTSFANGSGC